MPAPRIARGGVLFRYLWEGCNRFEQEVIDQGITVERVEFGVGGYADALEQIDERLQVGEKIDGLLAYVPGDDRATELLRQIARRAWRLSSSTATDRTSIAGCQSGGLFRGGQPYGRAGG